MADISCILRLLAQDTTREAQWLRAIQTERANLQEKKAQNRSKVDLNAFVTEENVVPGLRVTRGRDWNYGDEDGGEGCVGTVVEALHRLKWLVRWDYNFAVLKGYDVGNGGRYDLSIEQGRKIVIIPSNFIPGMIVERGPHWRWGDEDGGKGKKGILMELTDEDVGYVFWVDKKKVDIYRLGCAGYDLTLVQLPDYDNPIPCGVYGIFPGLPVVRGPEWNFGDVDGGPGEQGFVANIYDGEARIVWKKTGFVSTQKIEKMPKALFATYHYRIPANILSANNAPIVDNHVHVIVTPSNAKVDVSVIRGLHFPTNLQAVLPDVIGKIVSINKHDMTCTASFGETVKEFSIGKDNKYHLCFFQSVPMHLGFTGRYAFPGRYQLGTRVTQGPDFKRKTYRGQDGNPGLHGTITRYSMIPGMVHVAWDNGTQQSYFSSFLVTGLALAGSDNLAYRTLMPSDLTENTYILSHPTFGFMSIAPNTRGRIASVENNFPQSVKIEWEGGSFSTVSVPEMVWDRLLRVEDQSYAIVTVPTLLSRYSHYVDGPRIEATRAATPAEPASVRNRSHPLFETDGVGFDYGTTLKDFHGLGIDQSNIEIQKCIGSGGFGEVFLGRVGDTEVAVKKVHGSSQTNDSIESFLQEASILKGASHPNIVGLKGVSREINGIAIVMEYVPNGTLSDVKRNMIPPIRSLQIVVDCALGLAYIHDVMGIVHRDIKSANILLDRNFHAKIADFGLSKIRCTHDMLVTNTVKGSLKYMAPELLDGGFNEKIDVYSLGIVLWEIETGLEPYEGQFPPGTKQEHIFGYVCHQQARPQLGPHPRVHPHYHSLIQECWRQDPRARPSAVWVAEEAHKMRQSHPH